MQNLLAGLPLPVFRNPDVLIGLVPGFAPPPQTYGISGPSLSPGIGTAGSFSLNGIRSRDNNFNIDRSDYNDEEFGVRRQGFTTPFPQSIESISEYQIIAADGDARYGRSLGGDINVLTQSGGSRPHFTAYGFGTGDALRARDYFEQKSSEYSAAYRQWIPITTDGTISGGQVHFGPDPRYTGPIVVRNGLGYQSNPLLTPVEQSRVSAGFVAGGPISHKGTYGYISFEDELQNGNTQQSFSVPTMKQRGVADNGDTGGILPVTAPNGGGLPYFPSSILGDGIFSLVPFPNNPLGAYGANTYTAVLPNSASGYTYSARIDQDIRFLDRKHYSTHFAFHTGTALLAFLHYQTLL